MTEGGEWSGDHDPLADPEEQQHVLAVLDSFRSYRRAAHYNATHTRRQAFYSLPSSHWNLLASPPFSILSSLSHLDDLIDLNADLAEAIFQVGFRSFILPNLSSDFLASLVREKGPDELQVYAAVLDKWNVKATPTDLDKARSCINQFYRDWSAEGACEREACFTPILQTLTVEFPTIPPAERGKLRILIPGAGLGRLVFDICAAGYSVEGNEISYHELMASSLILNHTAQAGKYTLAPFALNSSNHLNREDQFQTFRIPDIHPETVLAGADVGNVVVPGFDRMSMTSGDFCFVYGNEENRGSFDAVATVFFIDTAPNIIRYIEAVHNCLKAGGIWINLGPLLWHHAGRSQSSNKDGNEDEVKGTSNEGRIGVEEPGSVELTDDEVVKLVQYFGFEIEKHETGMLETGYIQNPSSMLRSLYRPSFWVARKK
ncbi:methyltransferas-like protein [Lepidopterella palustris CBS 459.81]|uniref:carnosine N-methyltransferase n=1 Tax=Lepidopterella palustris CBS 459.81 TaxID=1314670 RepID=A0A8E2E2G9_9PEZI|nr:methyltransferas-like protein [Lepidopterella palustris CBS 459.81]